MMGRQLQPVLDERILVCVKANARASEPVAADIA
jgi:hypothetical protein